MILPNFKRTRPPTRGLDEPYATSYGACETSTQNQRISQSPPLSLVPPRLLFLRISSQPEELLVLGHYTDLTIYTMQI